MFKAGEKVHTHDGKTHLVGKSGRIPSGRRRRMDEMPRIRGFVRVALVEPDGRELPGDWYKNQITNFGWKAIVNNFAGMASSAVSNTSSIGSSDMALARWLAIGSDSRTATSDISAAVTFSQEYGTAQNSSMNIGNRALVTASQSNVGSVQLSQSWQFASSHITNNATLNVIGMAQNSSVGQGSLISIATFASSAKSSNQAVNVTYNFSFGT